MPNDSGKSKDLEHERRALQRRLSQLTPKARLDALTDSDDAQKLVRRTPAEDLYFAIQDVGLADATEIVQLATPRQFQTFVDLAAWKKGELDAHALLSWLRAAKGDEHDAFLDKVRGIDLELIEALLRKFTNIHDLEEDPDVNPEGVTFETPEGKYLVEFLVEGVELSAMRSLLNDLFGQNPFETTRLLEAVRWELMGELEETALRFRTARLSDLGFPEPEAAASLYAFVKPETVVRPPSTGPERPGADTGLTTTTRVNFLEEALNALDEEERETFEAELRYLINAALVADGADAGDLDAIRRISERARDYLCLALEYLSDGEPSRAVEVVRLYPSKRVFQVGFSLTLKLKYHADRLFKRPLAKVGDTEMVLAEELAVVTALRRRRPMKAVKVEGAEPMPFRALKELADAEAVLNRVDHQLTLFEDLLGNKPEAIPARLADLKHGDAAVDAERVLTAAVAQAILTHEPRVEPVPKARVVELCEALFEGTAEAPRLKDSARETAYRVLEARVPEDSHPELRRMVDRMLARMTAEIAGSFLIDHTFAVELTEILPVQEG